MHKTLKSKISPFGGIYLIHEQLRKAGAIEFIDNELGNRTNNFGFNYSEIVLSRIYTSFCGGDATEDVNYVREHTLKQLTGISIPSADTILRGEKELATECEYIQAQSENKINVNDKMNGFLIQAAVKFKAIDKTSKDLVYDFDHQFIPSEKYDATYSYKKERGYFPGVASIDGIPVYIEGRNGNCNVKTAQLSTHKRAIALLKKKGVEPAKARMDSGSYLTEVTDFFEAEKIKFYIRANQSDTLLFTAASTDGWIPCEIGFQQMEVNSFSYKFGQHTHRIVAYRMPNKTGQASLITGDADNYLFIITNDLKMSEQEVIGFYNQRGKSERIFDQQNNDFGWSSMPHSFLEHNTVYLIIMAVAHIFYKYVLNFFSKFIPGLTPTSRLKRFIFRFVAMPAKWVTTGRKTFLRITTDNPQLLQAMNIP